MTFLVELSAMLNTLDAFVASLLRCCGKLVFPNDVWSYKKRDRYKRNLEDAIEEKMNSMFETKFRSYMQSLTQERPLEL
jgi:HJR/Mrr/RecB family endonuclease